MMQGFVRFGRAASRHRVLEWASLAYVSLPFLVFVAGWLELWIAVPCLLVTLAGLCRMPIAAIRSGQGACESDSTKPGLRTWVGFAFALVVLIFVVVHSGTGGYAFQFGGHWRNNSFINDLAAYPWPLGFEDIGSDHTPGVLAFYIANALPPALVASVFGWEAGFFFQFVWTCMAVFLVLFWFMRVIGHQAPHWVLFFLFFGGLDVIGYWSLVGPYEKLLTELDLWTVWYSLRTPEMGGIFWIFPANLTILYNSPHHVLCSWLVLLMILDDALNGRTSRRVGLLCSFALLWSAFSFVGLAPFVILSLVWTRGRGMWSFENLGAGVCVLLTTALYIGSNNGDYLHGPLWTFQDLRDTGLVLLFVYVIEFGIQAVLVRQTESRDSGLAHPAWLWTAVGTLILIAWYRVGDFSDFTTKASIPALLVLQLCIAHALAGGAWRRPLAGWALVGVLLVGTVAPITLVARSAGRGLDASAPAIERVAPTNELERSSRGGQLFSDGDTFFWRILAKPVVFQPNRVDKRISADQLEQLRRAMRRRRWSSE